MGWQCKLYGHLWRRQGSHEVVTTGGGGIAYTVECALCGREQPMTKRGRPGDETAAGRIEERTIDFEVGESELAAEAAETVRDRD